MKPMYLFSKCSNYNFLSLWMKSYDMTIQMKLLQHHFHMVLLLFYYVLTFESVDEIL